MDKRFVVLLLVVGISFNKAASFSIHGVDEDIFEDVPELTGPEDIENGAPEDQEEVDLQWGFPVIRCSQDYCCPTNYFCCGSVNQCCDGMRKAKPGLRC